MTLGRDTCHRLHLLQVVFALKVVRFDSARAIAAFNLEVEALTATLQLKGFVQLKGALTDLPHIDGVCTAGCAGILLQFADMGSLQDIRAQYPLGLPFDMMVFIMATLRVVSRLSSLTAPVALCFTAMRPPAPVARFVFCTRFISARARFDVAAALPRRKMAQIVKRTGLNRALPPTVAEAEGPAPPWLAAPGHQARKHAGG